MRNSNSIIALAVIFAVMYVSINVNCLENKAEKTPVKRIKELPNEFQFFSNKVSVNLLSFVNESALWPNETKIEKEKVDRSLPEVKQSINYAIFWLKKIIKPQWLPEDIGQRLLPLGESLDGDDALWARYQIDDYAIQIVADYGRLRFFISPVDEKKEVVPSEDKEAMNALIVKVTEKFFKKSDAVNDKLTDVQVTHGIASGIPGHQSKRVSNLWWEQVQWWSDGKTIAFWIPHTDIDTAIKQPTRLKHWFTKPDKSLK